MCANCSINNSFTVLADTLNVFSTDVSVNTLSMGSALFSNTMNSSNSFYIKVNSREYSADEFYILYKRAHNGATRIEFDKYFDSGSSKRAHFESH